MDDDSKPYLGFSQPGTGSDLPLALLGMASKSKDMSRKSKKDRPVAIIQGVVAANVRQLRDVKYEPLPNVTAMNKALAKDADSTLSQIQRVIAGELAAGIDLIERLSMALSVTPSELMTPYFAQKQRSAAQAQQSPFESRTPPQSSHTPPDSSRS